MSTEPDHLRVTPHDDGRVLELTLAAPPGNVVDRALVESLRAALRHAVAEEAHALLLTADGPQFSYGASIHDHRPESVAPFLAAFHALFVELLESALPIAAAVHGLCLGGGLELAAFAHRVVAANDAQLGCPEIALGCFAPVASLVLPARIGQAAADDLLLTGQRVDAQRAHALRLVDEVVSAPFDPRETALDWIRERLLPLSRTALRFATRASRADFAATFPVRIAALERLYLDELMRTHDAVEGVRAFLEKRPAKWER